jgi:outer membrane protein assembly factor BamB
MKTKLIKTLLSSLLCMPFIAQAGAFDNTLWLGNNKNAIIGVLNINRDGKILRQVRNTEANGIAIDANKNRIYFGTYFGKITGRDLNSPAIPRVTFTPDVGVANDMAFDGQYIWRTDGDRREIQKINSTTGEIVFTFEPLVNPVGIAWDGQHLWLTEYYGSTTQPQHIVQYTPQGIFTGVKFPAPIGDDLLGGLAFDSTDNTLWVGGIQGKLYNVDTNGNLLKTVPIIDTTRSHVGHFIDGLEFQSIASCPTP